MLNSHTHTRPVIQITHIWPRQEEFQVQHLTNVVDRFAFSMARCLVGADGFWVAWRGVRGSHLELTAASSGWEFRRVRVPHVTSASQAASAQRLRGLLSHSAGPTKEAAWKREWWCQLCTGVQQKPGFGWTRTQGMWQVLQLLGINISTIN